jgi:hypothetical protein
LKPRQISLVNTRWRDVQLTLTRRSVGRKWLDAKPGIFVFDNVGWPAVRRRKKGHEIPHRPILARQALRQ